MVALWNNDCPVLSWKKDHVLPQVASKCPNELFTSYFLTCRWTCALTSLSTNLQTKSLPTTRFLQEGKQESYEIRWYNNFVMLQVIQYTVLFIDDRGYVLIILSILHLKSWKSSMADWALFLRASVFDKPYRIFSPLPLWGSNVVSKIQFHFNVLKTRQQKLSRSTQLRSAKVWVLCVDNYINLCYLSAVCFWIRDCALSVKTRVPTSHGLLPTAMRHCWSRDTFRW